MNPIFKKMNKTQYDAQAELLIKIIDIAINSLTRTPQEDFTENKLKLFVNTYLDYKNKIINPEPKFHNITSLKYIKSDVLTYFQEGSGKAVEAFWKEITAQNLDIIRVNRFEKILNRGKIKNQREYDIVIDLYNSYIETNMLSKQEIDKINDLILNFETSK